MWIPLEIVRKKIKVLSIFISKAVKELEKGDLVEIQQNSLRLTENGKKRAKKIFKTSCS